MVATLLEDDSEVPPLPGRPHGWHEMTQEWWEAVWSSPMSAEWHPETDFHNVVIAAMHYDDMWYAADAVARQKSTTLFLKTISPLGLTPYDRRRLEWQIETTEEAKVRGRRRRTEGDKPPATQSKVQAKADPRALHAI